MKFELADRTRSDGSAMIDRAEGGPRHGGVSGGKLAREGAARAEHQQPNQS